MKITADSSKPLSVKADLLVVALYQDKKSKNPLLDQVDQKLKKEITRVIKKEEFKGSAGEMKLISTNAVLKTNYVLLMGLGKKDDFTLETLRDVGSKIYSAANQIKAKKIISPILGQRWGNLSATDSAQAISEGALLKSYQFTKYVKRPTPSVDNLHFVDISSGSLAKVKKSVNLATTLCQGVFLTRDMVNTPSNDMTPLAMTKLARKFPGVRTRVHNLAAIKKMKMGAYLSVAQGSTLNPPYFIEMHYTPTKKAKKKIAIIGKGVTFDTGGYSLKPPKPMENMKDDMAGSAAVFGLMSIISKLKPDVAVSAYVAATENMVDGYAQKPGDVCKAMNGKTIEVLNTDAEGRLTMADALYYASKKKPDYMIDMATLTGACLVALGLQYTAAMGNDQKLIDLLIDAGKNTGEKLWQLPLAQEYAADLKSPIADLKNIAGPYAGTITAGLFLENFVGNTKWCHLDIAGTSWQDGKVSYVPARAGSGVMVRTLARFLDQF